ncbi:PREDICTED: uncharacterized protein LOC109585873 isoform X2 [Amphimedon queenslandica]|uniref:ZSWIM3 N-terminal domain-containing protein n=1 Tax=Amphimedon queenslandica TaxID=400682 RepID=A0AAN0JLA6_AMPQE|nr:PREDICTED: uncharacterized protein LOC109585873 isoform X2 [Amphimedon queenslandica]|eukprot:XP_019857580.1 PREDICTED: uncharacterized protein LOC109585873 isoform X2 [Amphimedon queenslandica]
MITWCLNHARLHTCLIMAAVVSKSVSSAEHSEAKARPQVPSFVLGERFESYDELEAKLKQYEKATYTQWWKRDCRTVDAAKRRVNRQLSDKIRYYEVVFKCINGGRKFKSKGEGIRSTMTFRQNCPAELSLIASEDGNGLVVKKFLDEHNHPVNKQLFRQLPKQRKLSNSEEEEAKQLLELRCNKKLLQDKLSSVSGKAVLLKDLSNLKTKKNNEKTRNNLETTVKTLIEKHGMCDTL